MQQPFRNHRGFTLIEVMIVVVVIAILAAIAIPSYQYFVRNAQRADGMSALMDIRTAQERWRANNPAYAGNTDIDSLVPFGATSPDRFWDLEITDSSPSTFRAIATKNTDVGLPDPRCDPLFLAFGLDGEGNSAPGLISQGPAECWKR